MSRPEPADPWILRPRPRPAARLRLLCIPHAGGGASAFRGWADVFPESIEVCPVQLPGREQRIREAPFDRLEPLVEALAGAVLRRAETPFAVFGHSNGALIGYELARRLRRRGERGPVHLVASGRRAPHVPPPPPLTHALPDEEFLDELARLGGIPAEVREHPELREMLLPVLRADVTVHETYEYQDEAPLEIPITGYAGVDDPRAPPDVVAEWAFHTAWEFNLRTWPGGHFYLAPERDRVIRQLVQDLGF
jgi:medium-chain acyl-[acyl-carrier-protein] hydrolase